MAEWGQYQEETAEFFRSIGLEARTNVRLQGIRTSHDIDVVVRSDHVGFNLLWIIECKHWKNPVSKLHVLALREIAADLGADRGILVSESGFQAGALEAASLTNVQLTSLADLKSTAGQALGMAQLRTIQDRTLKSRERYWNLSKSTRIEYGLRPDVPEIGYSGDIVLRAIEAALFSAFGGRFPVEPRDPISYAMIAIVDNQIFSATTPIELSERLEPLIADLENRLDTAYGAIERDTDAN